MFGDCLYWLRLRRTRDVLLGIWTKKQFSNKNLVIKYFSNLFWDLRFWNVLIIWWGWAIWLCASIWLWSGLVCLQSRRLTALLVRDSAPARLPNYRACRHHWMNRLRFANPRPQRARDRDPARRGMQERPRQCSPPRHCPRVDQSRRHSSVAPVPTPNRSHGRVPLSRLRSGLLPPHRFPHHLVPRLCQWNWAKVKHGRYGWRFGCYFGVHIGKVQVSGQSWKEEVVHMAPG